MLALTASSAQQAGNSDSSARLANGGLAQQFTIAAPRLVNILNGSSAATSAPSVETEAPGGRREAEFEVDEVNDSIEVPLSGRPFSRGQPTTLGDVGARDAQEVSGILRDEDREVWLLDYERDIAPTEPSFASIGNYVVGTANTLNTQDEVWWAVISSQRGRRGTFRSIAMPSGLYGTDSQGQGICCDQLLYSIPGADMLVWLMQGTKVDGKGNSLKLLVARVSQNVDDIAAGTARLYEIPASALSKFSVNSHFLGDQQIASSDPIHMDFPDVASTRKFLFVTVNLFSDKSVHGKATFRGTLLLRIPWADLRDAKPAIVAGWAQPFVEAQSTATLRLSKGAGDTMFFAGHIDDATLGVRRWSDAAADPSAMTKVTVDRWQRPSAYNGSTPASACSLGRASWNWLGRQDGRLSAAWIMGTQAGFAWPSGPYQATGVKYACNHVRVALVNLTDITAGAAPTQVQLASSQQPHLYSQQKSFAHVSVVPQSADVAAAVVAFAGQRRKCESTPCPREILPGVAVGYLRRFQNDEWKWVFTVAQEGGAWPSGRTLSDGTVRQPRWGDYLSLSPASFAGNTFFAAGPYMCAPEPDVFCEGDAANGPRNVALLAQFKIPRRPN